MLTLAQKNTFAIEARKLGLNDNQIAEEIAKKEAELQAGNIKVTQDAVSNVNQVSDMPDPVQENQGNFISNAAKAIVDPALKFGAFVGESVAQASRVGADAISGNQGIFGADDINKQVGQLALQDRQILAQMKAEKDPEKKKALAQQSRDLNAKIDALGNQAREIGSKQETFIMQDSSRIADRGEILETGAKRTAGAAAYAVPMGSGIKSTLALGGAAGSLSGLGVSEGSGVMETAMDIATGTAGGVAGAAILPLAGSLLRDGKTAGNRVLNKMLNPFTSQYDDEIVKLATSKGVDLPVSARTKSNTVKQLEAWAQKSFFGGKVTERIIKARDEVSALSLELTNKLAKDIDKKSIGEAVKNGFSEFENSFNKTKTELYNAVPKSVLNAKASAQSTQDTLLQIFERRSKSKAPNSSNYFEDLADNLFPGGADEKNTMEILKQTRADIWAKMGNFNDPIATGQKADLKAVYAALSDDIEDAIRATDQNAYKVVQEANNFYKQGIEKINSQIGRTIKDADPERLIDTLLKPNSETDIALVKSVVDEEAIKKLQEGFTSKIYNQSLDSKQLLDVKKLRNNLSKYGESSIKELLGDEGFTKFTQTVADLEDIDKLKQAIQRGAKPAEGSQTAFLLNQIGNAGLFAFSPVALGAKMGSELGLSKLLTTESGQKFLTEGLGEIVQKTGVQLSSPVEQIVSRLLALQGSKSSANFSEEQKKEQNSESYTITENIPTNQNNENSNNLFPREKTFTETAQVTSPMGSNVPDIIPQRHPDPRFSRYASKEEMVADAFRQGYDSKTIAILKRDWDENAPTQSGTGITPEVQSLIEQRTLLTKAGLSTRSIDTKLAQYGFETTTGQTEAEKNYGPAVSRSLKQLEAISGIGTDKTLFTGGSTTIGKAVKGVGVSSRLATDAEFAEKANQYRSSLNLVIGAINQLLGAGVLNDGEAERLISTMPNEYTSEADAKAWFENARVTLNVK